MLKQPAYVNVQLYFLERFSLYHKIWMIKAKQVFLRTFDLKR